MFPVRMRSWKLAFLCCSLLLLSAGMLRADNLPGQFSDELTTDHYNCSICVQGTQQQNATAAIHLRLEADNGENEIRLEITRAQLRLLSVDHGVTHVVGSYALTMSRGSQATFLILRRGASLSMLHGQTLFCHATVPVCAGTRAAITVDNGWMVTSSTIQRLEPVTFADDFMRTSDDPDTARRDWTLVSGNWSLQSAWDHLPGGNSRKFASTIFAQNPFTWIGVGKGNTPAVCTTGYDFWEDYTVTASVFPPAHGAVGLLLNLSDPGNGLLVRWSSAHDAGADGNQLTLYRLVNGVRSPIAKSSGGFIPGQWYRIIATASIDGVRIRIDNTTRIDYQQSAWRHGGIGLYSEGVEGTVFDHVSAYGLNFDTDLQQEIKQSAISAKFLNDTKGMKEWSVNPDEWQDEQLTPGKHWSGTSLYGDHSRIYLSIKPIGLTIASPTIPDQDFSGSLTMELDGDPAATTPAGYRAVIAVAGTPAEQTYTIYRGDKVLASKSAATLDPDVEYKFRFSQIGQRLRLDLDDSPVLQASDPHPLTQGFAGYYIDGQAFATPRDAHTTSGNTRDYTFAEAPTDWLAVGTWMPSMRWSCQPQWSFLGGWSRGDAVLWHKERFTGEQTLEAFMGVKMEYPREHTGYYTRFHGYFAVTICGDGDDPRNGYSGIYGASDEDGFPYQRAVLLRNGVIVAAMPIKSTRTVGENHHLWFKLTLEKHGSVVAFNVKLNDETYDLSYPDPKPIDGGIPAIWTHDNAISLARVRINCAQPSVPWPGPQVTIDSPWYPEWVNIGQPETLAFPESWSITGKPVALQVTPQTVSAGDEHALVTHGLQATFTPSKKGAHWYQVTAGDGTHHSQPFHVDQLVFNPALGRDDSHALLLYRFDEGTGTVVHDHSPVGAHLDLTVPPDPANACWVNRQGLTLRGPTPLLPAGNADKLLPLTKAKGCTLECWISTDTIFPPPSWISTLFSLGSAGDDKTIYLMVGQTGSSLKAGFPGTKVQDADSDVIATSFTTSLHHYVITWDEQETRAYDNGELLAKKPFPWQPGEWQPNVQLTIGQGYLGTYYLLALHDRCLTPEEVKRHYQAGPSAKGEG